MRTPAKGSTNSPLLNRLATGLAGIAIVMLIQGCASSSVRPESRSLAQAEFASSDEAVASLITAFRAHDLERLHHILGPEADDILNSGDPVADELGIDSFVHAYDARHRLVAGEKGSVILIVGDNDWPVPIPVIKDADSGAWFFDTAAGKEEILNRRVGRNELTVIEVCRAIADAQREYAARDPDNDGIPQYAQKFISDPGKKNGLYWETQPGETPSPLGPLVADAVVVGYSATPAPAGNEPRPFHGYLYRMLTSQGPAAQGGQLDYMINGKMVGGFAALAYPADYGNSGIMTFMVDYRGDVYQKDLGLATSQIARQIAAFDPGAGWRLVETGEHPTTRADGGITQRAADASSAIAATGEPSNTHR
jgi:hypothetical protein